MYRCRPVKAVCSSNISNQNVCILSSVSKLVEPLTVSKPVCSTILSKNNISNVSNISQHVKHVHNRNVHIINSVSHHTKPFSVGKSDCSRNVSKPLIHKSVVANLNKRAHKQSFNVSSQKHGVAKSLNARSILMTSIYFYGWLFCFSYFDTTFTTVTLIIFSKVMSRVTAFPGINF